jgi:hypothetical protein
LPLLNESVTREIAFKLAPIRFERDSAFRRTSINRRQLANETTLFEAKNFSVIRWPALP